MLRTSRQPTWMAVALVVGLFVMMSEYDSVQVEAAGDLKVILVQGIASTGVNCNDSTSATRYREVKRKLINANIGLSDGDILEFSYGNAYCSNNQSGVDYARPVYPSASTCFGVFCAASYLTRLVNAHPSSDFVLIGHSLGGLVVSAWTAQLDFGHLVHKRVVE